MPVRNQHPVQLTVLNMPPGSAVSPSRGDGAVRVDTAYSSYFVAGTGGGNSFEMDGELARTGFKAGVGLGGGLAVHGEIAFAHTSGGFLDSFLIDYHEFFGFPEQGRTTVPRNRFAVNARRSGALAYEMDETGIAPLDLPLELRWSFLPLNENEGFAAALRGAVELPIGDQARGFGNGGLDYSIGVMGEWRWPSAAVTAHLQHTIPATPDAARAVALDYADVTTMGVAGEVWVSDATAVLAQTTVETSTLRDLGFRAVEEPQWLLWLGLRTRVSPRVVMDLGFGEDLSIHSAPDFSAYLSFRFDLGAPSQ